MKTLILLRHAKSDWSDPDLSDHDRPLNPRGRAAAAAMSEYLRAGGEGPPALDGVLCSSARRARDTMERVLPAWPVPPVPSIEPGLYLCGALALLERLRRLPDGVGRVLLVGHNPDLHDLACRLAITGGAEALVALRQKYPTGALAELALPDGSWRDLTGGRLVRFVRPRDLMDPDA
ncbi:SixA phosphatase family protein [Oleisolibacter albus]|uniref:SixA phosphatase family protein n=1 Tax=Oleisolibacter albus TaxID=2171757 RepID=UPI000DF11FD6|nr:histidine phosphatase family protein [Oleisolibacter albus]